MTIKMFMPLTRSIIILLSYFCISTIYGANMPPTSNPIMDYVNRHANSPEFSVINANSPAGTSVRGLINSLNTALSRQPVDLDGAETAMYNLGLQSPTFADGLLGIATDPTLNTDSPLSPTGLSLTYPNAAATFSTALDAKTYSPTTYAVTKFINAGTGNNATAAANYEHAIEAGVNTGPITSAIYERLGLAAALDLGVTLDQNLGSNEPNLAAATSDIQRFAAANPDVDLTFLISGSEAPLSIANMQNNFSQALIPTTEPGHDQTTISNNLNALATAITDTGSTATKAVVDPQLYTAALAAINSDEIQLTGSAVTGSSETATEAPAIYAYFQASFKAPAGTVPAEDSLALLKQNPAAFKQAASGALWILKEQINNGELDPDDVDAVQEKYVSLVDSFLKAAGYVELQGELPAYDDLKAELAPVDSNPTIPETIPTYAEANKLIRNPQNPSEPEVLLDLTANLAGYQSYPADDEPAARQWVEFNLEEQQYGASESSEEGWMDDFSH